MYRELHTGLKGELIDIAAYETWFQQRMLASGLTVKPEMFAVPTRQTLISAVTSRPFQGRLLREWVEGLDAGRFARLRDAIRIGVVEGESIEQIYTIEELKRREAAAFRRAGIDG